MSPRGTDRTGLHGSLRTIDVARRVGCSVQHVRDLERAGVLPPAARSPAGHRCYGEVHVRSAAAYRALAAGVGPAGARALLSGVHRLPAGAVLALLDEVHARLDRERRDLRLARAAVAAIAAEPLDRPLPSDAMTISELAGALGTTPATLRHWEAEGVLAPDRQGRARIRSYSPAQVRDARVVHQLRLAGYGLAQLRALLPGLLDPASRSRDVVTALEARDRSIAVRSRALLRASAVLDTLIAEP